MSAVDTALYDESPSVPEQPPELDAVEEDGEPRIERTAANEEELRQIFQEFDHNGDGRISRDELAIVLRQAGEAATPQQLAAMIRQVDTDGNGTIELGEFLRMMRVHQANKRELEKRMQLAFKVFDVNGDNYISRDDLEAAMTKLGHPLTECQIDAMMLGVAALSFKEFKAILADGNGSGGDDVLAEEDGMTLPPNPDQVASSNGHRDQDQIAS